MTNDKRNGRGVAEAAVVSNQNPMEAVPNFSMKLLYPRISPQSTLRTQRHQKKRAEIFKKMQSAKVKY